MLIVMEIKINKSLLLFSFIKKQNKIISKLNIKNRSFFFEKTDRSYFFLKKLMFSIIYLCLFTRYDPMHGSMVSYVMNLRKRRRNINGGVTLKKQCLQQQKIRKKMYNFT